MNPIRLGVVMLLLMVLATRCMYRPTPVRAPLNEQDLRLEQDARGAGRRPDAREMLRLRL